MPSIGRLIDAALELGHAGIRRAPGHSVRVMEAVVHRRACSGPQHGWRRRRRDASDSRPQPRPRSMPAIGHRPCASSPRTPAAPRLRRRTRDAAWHGASTATRRPPRTLRPAEASGATTHLVGSAAGGALTAPGHPRRAPPRRYEAADVGVGDQSIRSDRSGPAGGWRGRGQRSRRPPAVSGW